MATGVAVAVGAVFLAGAVAGVAVAKKKRGAKAGQPSTVDAPELAEAEDIPVSGSARREALEQAEAVIQQAVVDLKDIGRSFLNERRRVPTRKSESVDDMVRA